VLFFLQVRVFLRLYNLHHAAPASGGRDADLGADAFGKSMDVGDDADLAAEWIGIYDDSPAPPQVQAQ
jgi:hypothetical protein